MCLVELKARFDERRNIEWSRAMEQAGVHVVHGFRDLKIHAKTTLVIRREGGVLRRYAHIGTGNYNGVTARLYEDLGLFTDDEAITSDVADLFNHMTGFGRPQQFRKLLVAPFNLRTRLIDHIRAVADAAGSGQTASVRMKVNSLTDPAIIEELYRASQAGARIDIVARSICSLRPGVPGLSERIHVRSIAGRFLEHSRLFAFEAGDKATYLLGSADIMPRNLDHRIEVAEPGRGRPSPARDLDDLRHAARRPHAGLGARRRRDVDAPSPRAARDEARKPRGPHAARPPAGAAAKPARAAIRLAGVGPCS